MRYAKLRIKLVLKYYLGFAALSLALFLLLGAVSSFLLKSDTDDETKQMYTVGVCGSTDTAYLGFGIDMMTQMDSSSGYIKLVECTRNEAEKRLENGDFSAYIYIPEGFADSIFSDELIPLEFVTKDASGGMTAVLKEELLSAVSTFLVHAQKSYYGFASAMIREGKYDPSLLDTVNIKSFMLVIARDDISRVRVSGVSGGLSLSEYMLCGISVLWLMLCSAPYCTLFVKRDLSLQRILKSRGISSLSQTSAEYFSYFLSVYLNALTGLVIAFVLKGTLKDVLALAGIDPGLFDFKALIVIALSVIPAVLVVTAFQFMLFSCSTQIVSGILLQFFGCVAISYIGGCMYPISFFPPFIRVLSVILPSGAARGYLTSLITENGVYINALICVLISVALISVTVLVSRIRLSRE